jgi:hypothetical protein
MRRFTLVACLLILLCSSCAFKKYEDKSLLGTVDRETRTAPLGSRTSIDIQYDGGDFISVEVNNVRLEKEQRRNNLEHKQCWDIEYDFCLKDIAEKCLHNPLCILIGAPAAIMFDIIGSPFYILGAILENPKPGCKTWTKWTNWEDGSERQSVTAYRGEVTFVLGDFSSGRVEPATVHPNDQGIATTKLLLDYPYVTEKNAENMRDKVRKTLQLTASANGEKSTVDIDVYDISGYSIR